MKGVEMEIKLKENEVDACRFLPFQQYAVIDHVVRSFLVSPVLDGSERQKMHEIADWMLTKISEEMHEMSSCINVGDEVGFCGHTDGPVDYYHEGVVERVEGDTVFISSKGHPNDGYFNEGEREAYPVHRNYVVNKNHWVSTLIAERICDGETESVS
jgi:hypothetical protein